MTQRKDLVDIADENYHSRQGEYMACQVCGKTIGGTRGDYWEYPMDYVFTCECGSKDIALVKNVTQQVIIKQ